MCVYIYIYMYIYIYIRGVTVHKIPGSVRYNTMVSVCFLYGGAGQLVTLQWISNKHAFAPGFAPVQT